MWEEVPVGYLLREARESVDLTQRDMAERLGSTQQAVAQAEHWGSNPTTDFLRRWAAACGKTLVLGFIDQGRRPALPLRVR